VTLASGTGGVDFDRAASRLDLDALACQMKNIPPSRLDQGRPFPGLRKNRLWAAIWKQRAEAHASAKAFLGGEEGRALSLPPGPPVAKLFRTSRTFRDVVLRWRVMAPLSEERAAVGGMPRTEQEERVIRHQLADRLIQALDGGGLEAAQAELEGWILKTLDSAETAEAADEWLRTGRDHYNPAARVLLDADEVLLSLLLAFRDPTQFFEDHVWRIDIAFPPATELEKVFRELIQDAAIDSAKSEAMLRAWQPTVVARALDVWGPGALLNRQVHETFHSLTAEKMRLVLSIADRRSPYREGRGKGRKDPKPRRRRVDAAQEKAAVYNRANELEEETGDPKGVVARATKERAEDRGVKPSAIKRRMTPRKPKK
jgi:hypothetical protein